MLNTMQSHSPREKDESRQAGFALIEVLVALAISALALSVLFAVLSDGARRTSHAEKLARAALQAQSLLAAVGSQIALKQGLTTGQLDDGLRWQLRIDGYGDSADRRAWPVTAYQVSVEMAWTDGGRERSLGLTTLRLGPKESGR